MYIKQFTLLLALTVLVAWLTLFNVNGQEAETLSHNRPREEVNYCEKTVYIPAFRQNVVQADFFIRAEDDRNILLQIRNKKRQSLNRFSPDNIILFVHGATFPSETSFDLQLGGMSWMDYMANQDYDAYFINVRAYGDSSRLPDTGLPIVRTVTAASDYATAVKYIMRRRGVSKINVMGWSWGTSITTTFATNYPELVNRLVIYAPQWYRNWQTTISGSYRNTSIDGRKASWLTGVAANKADSIIPPGWFEEWEKVTFAKALINENGKKYLSTPTGIVFDNNDYWFTGKNLYNSTKLNMPVLVIRAEWDADLNVEMSLGYFKNLTQVPYKKFVQIPEGTHQVLLEKNRMLLFREVQTFLTEEKTVPLSATDYDLKHGRK